MNFSSILLRNRRLMAVLRNLFALLVSGEVVYCQHARKSYLASTETRCQLWDQRRMLSTGKYIHGFNLFNYFSIIVFIIIFIFVAF